MSAVGLVYVGAVLFINGLLLLGWLTNREAGPMNIFVGALQVLTPTYLIMTSGGDSDVIFPAAGIYLFGFTYLWVGINCMKSYSQRGFGWFALYVSVCCVVFALYNFFSVNDAGFGVIWVLWGVLWFGFFLVLGLNLDQIAAATGVFTVVVALITAVGAFQELLESRTGGAAESVIFAIIGALALIAAQPAAKFLSVNNKEADEAQTMEEKSAS